jgi:ATP-dependent DNA ligase
MRKADLIKHCVDRGILLLDDIKLTNKQIEYELGKWYLDNNPQFKTWGMEKRLNDFQTPQLCFNFKELKPEEQYEILTSEDWIAETKIDGLRAIICYHPDYGFEFFSRDISEITFLPNSYTDKIVMMKNGMIRNPRDYRGLFPYSFVLDGEVIVSDKNLDTTSHGGGFSVTELNSTVSILGSAPERARAIQMDGNPLKFFIFDCLEIGGKDLTVLPLRKRREYMIKIVDTISRVTPFQITAYTIRDKQMFFDNIVSSGGEGTVLKNLNERYYATPSRKRAVQVKMKRTVSESNNTDIDAFISGSILPRKGSSLETNKLIGGIKLSLFIDEPDGSQTEHWIGTISGITDSLRRKLTVLDEEGNPTLNPAYLNKVMRIEGQDISSENHRLTHCRACDFNLRYDKSPGDCTLERAFIEKNIL